MLHPKEQPSLKIDDLIEQMNVGEVYKFKRLNWSQYQDIKIKYIGVNCLVVEKSYLDSSHQEYIIKLDDSNYDLMTVNEFNKLNNLH